MAQWKRTKIQNGTQKLKIEQRNPTKTVFTSEEYTSVSRRVTLVKSWMTKRRNFYFQQTEHIHMHMWHRQCLIKVMQNLQNPNTQIYDSSLFWLDTGIQIKSCGVKLNFVRKLPTLTNNRTKSVPNKNKCYNLKHYTSYI